MTNPCDANHAGSAWNRWLNPALLSVLLGACGGGGGSGASKIQITTSTNSIDVSANINSENTPRVEFNVSATNLPANATVLSATSTTRGIQDLGIGGGSPSTALVSVQFKEARSLRPGDYSDTISLKYCADTACKQVIAGAHADVPVIYHVGAATGANAVTVHISPSSVAASAFLYDQYGPSVSPVQISLDNLHVITPFVDATSTQHGVSSVFYSIHDSTTAQMDIRFANPPDVGKGSFHDTATVTLCFDLLCVNPMPGSPFTVNIDYTVSDSGSSNTGESYTVRVIDTQVKDLAWDSSRGVLYVLLPNDPTLGYENYVATLDPATGALGPKTSWGASVNRLALSDDNHYLYAPLGDAPQVRRMTVPDFTLDLTIPLPKDANNHILYASDVQVAPARPHTIAVAFSGAPGGGLPDGGVAIFDDATLRPNRAAASYQAKTGPLVDYLQWGADASVLYGTSEQTMPNLFTLAVDAGGVSVSADAPNIGFGRIHYAGGKLYSDNDGIVIDPATQTVVGRFGGIAGSGIVVPDVAGQHYFTFGQDSSNKLVLRRYDLATFTEQAAIALPYNLGPMGRMLRWGSNGLAYVSGLGLVIITGPFVAP